MILPSFYVDEIINTALKEDINYVDISADYLIDEEQKNDAYFVAKAEGILCGIDVAMRVFELLDPDFKKKVYFKDGDAVKKGDVIAEFSGHTTLLLKGERTALNLIQHMSGIATATNRAVRLCEGTGAQITDTRKTLPGMRALQKYAVTCGGGRNHRFNLSDCAMLKDNHIDAAGGITGAVNKLRSKLGHTVKIEVETRDLDEVNQAADAGADIIMLDNMSNEMMRSAIGIIGGRAKTEASGGITLDNVREVAETGVDIISLGALTHSVKAFDISMKMK
ncbi:MAG: carboxylating nicotinate-nucleotide diphosphorylase [Ruminococcaceae bacterium]|nr:carboxylating nicotinate-nucleotide diphosphorylase [Oscillospiraceae bacterium]